LSTEKAADENEDLCADLKDIESDLIRELIRLYRQGTDYDMFWERVERVMLLTKLRKKFCQD
jgi:hypothetical protein